MRTVNILGVPVHAVTFQETVDWMRATVKQGRRAQICTPNVDHFVLAQGDNQFLRAMQRAELVVPDSHWVMLAGRFLGKPVPEVVPGSELIIRFCDIAAEEGFRVYFLGAAPGVAQVVADRLKARFAGLQVVGAQGPTRAELDSPQHVTRLVEAINLQRPHLLFVAFGTPYQEKWIAAWLNRLAVNIAIGVGSSFDYVAGIQRRAPRWMYHTGLEWLYRLARDPYRLLPRYLLRDPLFFAFLLAQRLGVRQYP